MPSDNTHNGGMSRRSLMARFAATAATGFLGASLFADDKRVPGKDEMVFIDGEWCIACGLCVKECPTAAIFYREKRKDYQIDQTKCKPCGKCAPVCPVNAVKFRKKEAPAEKKE